MLMIDHLRYILSFDDPGAADDHLAKGVTVGDIRMWHDTIEELQEDLARLWHFAGCPFDHCGKCIEDAAWIKNLEGRLGPPSAKSVQAQHDQR